MVRSFRVGAVLGLLGGACTGTGGEGETSPAATDSRGSTSGISGTSGASTDGSSSGAGTGTTGGPVESGIRVRIAGEFNEAYFNGEGFHVSLHRICAGEAGTGTILEETIVPHGPPYPVVELETRWSDLPAAGPDCSFEYRAWAVEDWFDTADVCDVYEGGSQPVAATDAPPELVAKVELQSWDCWPSTTGDPSGSGGDTGTSTSTSG